MISKALLLEMLKYQRAFIKSLLIRSSSGMEITYLTGELNNMDAMIKNIEEDKIDGIVQEFRKLGGIQ